VVQDAWPAATKQLRCFWEFAYPLHLTDGGGRYTGGCASARVIRAWDTFYRERAAQWPMFLACEVKYLELNDPPQIRESEMRRIFDTIPATRNPPRAR
jgi:hypothetical protein